jgi:TP901 family phage tail tape measure protein
MADLTKTVKIIFAGEDKLSQTINGIEGGLNNLSANVSKATQPLADFTDSILKVDAVLLALAAGGLALATKTAGEFADSFNEISTLIEAPTDQLAAFKDNILDYSRDSVSGIEEITGSIYQIISATGDWENSLQTLEAAEKLNVAGAGQLDETTKLLVTSLNAYGKGADEATDFTNILFTTVKVGVTNLSELGASLGTVTGLAASAGVPFLDLNAAVGALTGTVGNTSLAVTQIKGVLTAIVKPSEQAKKAAEELGIEFSVQALKAEGLEGFLKKVYDATDGNSAVMAKLFGRVEGLNGALVLGADTSGKYADALKGMAERAGAVEAAFEKMANNFEFVNQKLINNLKATLTDIGEPLLDEWAGIAAGISGIFQGISVGIDNEAFAPVFALVEDFGQDIADALSAIGQAMPEALGQLDWTGLEAAFKTLGDAARTVFKDIFGDLDITDADDLAKAIQTVVKGVEALIQTTAGIVLGLGPFFKGLKEIADKMLDMDAETFKVIGQIAGFGKGLNVVAEQIPKITGALNIFSGAIGLLSLTRLPGLVTMLSGAGGLAATFGMVVAAATPLLAVFAALTPDSSLGAWLRDNSQGFNSFATAIDDTLLKFSDYDTKAIALKQAQGEANVELGKAVVALHDLAQEVDAVPDQKPVNVFLDNLDKFYIEGDKLILYTAEQIPDEKTIEIKPDADIEEFGRAFNIIYDEVGNKIIEVPVETKTDDKNLTETKKKIEKATPAERITIAKLTGEIDVELAKIEAQADVLKTAFEWQAKLDIAEVEAGAARLETVANLVSKSFEGTGEVIGDIVGALNDASGYAALIIQKELEKESQRRDALLVLQQDLTAAEIALTEARTKKLESGGGLITIEASGVYPELDLVLQAIIERAQIQANAEGTAFLLGG